MTAKRILIVEDERIVALDERATLVGFGYEVVGIAASCADALAKADELRPDLVLMDVRLEGPTDGIATAALLLDRYDVAIVYLTANVDATTLGRALVGAPGGFVTKPFTASALRAAIEMAFRRGEHETLRQQEQATAEATLKQERDRLKAENAILAREHRELENLVIRLNEDATHDPLTHLFNRRQLDAILERELSLAQRQRFPVGVIMLDLDHFKRFNDTHGHQAGDSALKAVAEVVASGVRVFDSVFRFGGEELLVVAPGATLEDSRALAERLRAAVRELSVRFGDVPLPRITASFGVASAPEQGLDGAQLVRAADQALYAAKAGGRDRVVCAPRSKPDPEVLQA